MRLTASQFAAGAAVAVLGLTVSARGSTVVGVQFPEWYGGISDPLNGGGGNGYTAGVIQQQYWNVANVFTNAGDGAGNTMSVTNADLVNSSDAPLSSTLMTSTGGTSNVQFTLSNASSSNHPNANGFPGFTNVSGAVNNIDLADGIFFSTSNTTPVTLTLSGLNVGDSYTLIAYVSAAWYAGQETIEAQLGSTTPYYLASDPGTSLSTFTRSTYTSPTGVPIADYVEYDNVLGLTLESEPLVVSTAFSGLDGFQLVDNGLAVPEPASLGLLGLGAAGLLFRPRRRRGC